MCGIFGIIAKRDSNYSGKLLARTLKKLALLSESRGKDSSGIAFRQVDANEIKIIRSAMPISHLFKEKIVKKEIYCTLKSGLNGKKEYGTFSVIGHARLVTNGSQLDDNNNQPVSKDGIICVHNGIIVNVNELWGKYQGLNRKFDIDTEIMLSLIRYHLSNNSNTSDAVIKSIKEVEGTVATALFFNDRDKFVLATNNGSLYILTNFKDILIFASEKFMLQSLLRDNHLNQALGNYTLKQVFPCTGYLLNYSDFSISEFYFNRPSKIKAEKTVNNKLNIKIINIPSRINQQPFVVDIESIHKNKNKGYEEKLLEFNIDKIRKLRRCTRCILPETFPFIKFDNKGVCNYCNNYIQRNHPRPIEELKKLVKPYKIRTGEPNVIVMLSGGRDSCFTLHMAKKVLGLHPIAFTYDWGMVTDLARRNIARVCGKLGVENIIVSADIRTKRENIRKNILAWLKRPHLGAVPLFMAGDKYFFSYLNKVKKQTSICLSLTGANPLERTLFKAGFAGLTPSFTTKLQHGYTIPNHIKLIKFIGRGIFDNPAYINSSILDSLGSYFVRFFLPRKGFYRFFEYYRWNEKEIENLLFNEYKWEKAKDTPTTWRIGDGTASFYNYIYFTIAGFSECETFRSNQIREGMISREEALRLVEKENYPRYESIKWYLDIVGLDYEDTINKINAVPKLYK